MAHRLVLWVASLLRVLPTDDGRKLTAQRLICPDNLSAQWRPRGSADLVEGQLGAGSADDGPHPVGRHRP